MCEARKADVLFKNIRPEDGFLEDGIHVWRFHAGQSDESLLSEEETRQASKYQSVSARSAFVAGRSGIRRAASLYTGIPPRDLQILPGTNGKPFFQNGGIHFNLSHSGSAVVAAFSRFPVGIDVESRGRCRDFEGIARRYFHPSEADLVSKSNNEEQFLRLWTGKEAMLKLSGEGLAQGLQKARPGGTGIGMLNGREVRLATFSFENYIGTVASFQADEVKGWFQF